MKQIPVSEKELKSGIRRMLHHISYRHLRFVYIFLAEMIGGAGNE